jgi:thiopurine S-methyltransferase
MQQGYWADRWRADQIGFHVAEVNRRLLAHAHRLPPPPAPLLVPLCGKSQDLAWLADRGHPVLGVEFVEQAARAFFAERGVEPQVGRAGPHLSLSTGGVTIVVADFFAVDPALVGRFPAVWDRAALIAVPPEQQRPYLERLRALVADDGRVLLVTYDHDLPGGPPYPVSGGDVERLSAGLFTPEPLEDEDILAEEPRFRERGATRIHERLYLLRPL